MITIATDFSKRTSQFSVFDNNGNRVHRCKLENKPELLIEFVSRYPGPKTVVLEATRNWGLFYDTVAPYCDRFLLGHPKKMKAITESETKNDKRDADLIGQLALSGFLPKAHVSSQQTRHLRSLLRFRYFLVGQRRSIRNQVQILLDRNLWPCQRPRSFKDPFCQRGLRWMQSLELPKRERFILDRLLESFHQLSERIQAMENFIQKQPWDEISDLSYLRKIPGYRKSIVNAYVVLTEIDDIQRFKKARHLAHYAGLIPSEHSSGDKHRTGRLVKDANHRLRTAIIESTFAAIRADKGLKAYYQKVKKQSGSGSAIIACARKLCYAIYHVLKFKVDYKPFQPPVTAYLPSSIPSKG